MNDERSFHVWGAGGHGTVVADVVRTAGGEVVGYIDNDPDKLGDVVDGHGSEVVVLQDDLIGMLERGERPDGWDAVVVAIGDNRVRHELFERLSPAETPTLVHPSAAIADSAGLGRGTVVCANAAVNPGARIGDAVIVNTGAIVEHDARVGDGAHVAPNATLCGVTRVGPRTLIGAGSTVLETHRVGRDCRVGAGAVVDDDLPAETTAVGIPVRQLTC